MFKIRYFFCAALLMNVQTSLCMGSPSEEVGVDPSIEGMLLVKKRKDLKPFKARLVAYVYDQKDDVYDDLDEENDSYQLDPSCRIKYAYIGWTGFYRVLKRGSRNVFNHLTAHHLRHNSLLMRPITFEERCCLERLRRTGEAFIEWKNLWGLGLEILTKELTTENKRRLLYNVSSEMRTKGAVMLQGNLDPDSPLSTLPRVVVRSINLFLIDDELKELLSNIAIAGNEELWKKKFGSECEFPEHCCWLKEQ